VNSQRLSRLLWLVAILSAGGLGFLMFSPVQLEGLAGGDVKPISVPGKIDDALAVPPEYAIDIPQWNPFDPNGEAWTLVPKREVEKSRFRRRKRCKWKGSPACCGYPGYRA